MGEFSPFPHAIGGTAKDPVGSKLSDMGYMMPWHCPLRSAARERRYTCDQYRNLVILSSFPCMPRRISPRIIEIRAADTSRVLSHGLHHVGQQPVRVRRSAWPYWGQRALDSGHFHSVEINPLRSSTARVCAPRPRPS